MKNRKVLDNLEMIIKDENDRFVQSINYIRSYLEDIESDESEECIRKINNMILPFYSSIKAWISTMDLIDYESIENNNEGESK